MAAFDSDRRRILIAAISLAPAASAVAAAGCARPDGARSDTVPESARPLRVPLASLPLGERVRVRMGERPVELVRGPDHVRARSLWCTHMGCEVAWEPAKDRYCCGCHGGEFDEDGEPVAGPPERPLRVLVTHLDGADVVIDPPGAAS